MATHSNGHTSNSANGASGHPGSHGDSRALSTDVQEFHALPAPNPADIIFSPDDLKQINLIIARYPHKQAAVMPLLWLSQEKFGWLSQEAIRLVAQTLSLPEADVFGVASFYTMYWKKPVGKLHLAVCTNISCMLSGGYELYDYIRKTYRIENGGVTPDGNLSLEEAECLGSCGTAPMMQINNDIFIENLTLDQLKVYLKEKGL